MTRAQDLPARNGLPHCRAFDRDSIARRLTAQFDLQDAHCARMSKALAEQEARNRRHARDKAVIAYARAVTHGTHDDPEESAELARAGEAA